MKKLLIVSALAALTGCASQQHVAQNQAPMQYASPGSAQIGVIKDPLKQMDRADVIQAARDCINAKMKPVIQNLPQQTTHGVIVIPVFVSCDLYRD